MSKKGKKAPKELFYDYEQNLLLIPATELTKLRLTCTKCFIRSVDMIHERRRESDVSINHTMTSYLLHFMFCFVVCSINRSVHIYMCGNC